jgi:cell wall-associated NlpC family hydrolase
MDRFVARLFRLVPALALMAGAAACASSSGARPTPFPGSKPPVALPRPTPATPDEPLLPAPPFVLADVVKTALRYLGVPYRLGGESPETGFDCSGLVRHVMAEAANLDVPRTVSEQYLAGTRVGTDEIRAGDLVFFHTVASGASHVGIALNAMEFVHAPGTNRSVRIDRLDATYWHDRLIGVRRLIQTPPAPRSSPRSFQE